MKRVKSRKFSERALQPDARGAVALVNNSASPAKHSSACGPMGVAKQQGAPCLS